MKQDPDVKTPFEISSEMTRAIGARRFKELRRSKEDQQVMFVKGGNEYPDFITYPFMMIGDKLKKVLSLYQPNLAFKMVVMIDHQQGRQTVYHAMAVPEIDGASELTIRHFGKIKTLILDGDKVGNNRIFRVIGDNRVIVRLDVVESMLRRIPYGIIFEPVELKEKVGVKNGK